MSYASWQKENKGNILSAEGKIIEVWENGVEENEKEAERVDAWAELELIDYSNQI